MAIQVTDTSYWVGVQDYNLREFHGPTFHIPNGTTYNSYLIVDEEITLIDLVEIDFFDKFYKKIKSVIGDKKITNLIINHSEPDHSGAFLEILKIYPDIKVYCTKKAGEFMDLQYGINYSKYNLVTTGSKLNIGKNTLEFIEMKMLHWPDSMATYSHEEKILYSNDAFGQHIASTKIFDDGHDLDYALYESKRYYANIIMPMARILAKKLEEIKRLNLDIDIIAPSHGIIWRTYVDEILQAYFDFATWKTCDKVIICYDTTWKNTEKMAEALADGFSKANMEVKFYQVSKSDVNEIMTEMVDAKAVLIGSSTIYGGMIANIAYLLEEMRILKPQEKIGFAFGSNGWAKGAVPRIEATLNEIGFEIFEDGVNTKFLPTEDDIKNLHEIAIKIARQCRGDLNGEKEIHIKICERCHSNDLIKLRELAQMSGYILHTEYSCLYKCGSTNTYCKYNDELIEADTPNELWDKIINLHTNNISK